MIARLTDAEILCMHKWMWTDMQLKLGDKPGSVERIKFKQSWCEEHHAWVRHNCFLCEHAREGGRYFSRDCTNCLVVWPDGICYSDKDGTIPESDSYYLNAPISDILNLPTKEFMSGRRTVIFMRECDIAELKKRMEEGE